MLLRLNPGNCFGIDADGRLVSTATLMCYGTQLGWVGMVLTNQTYRRRGFARTLLLHAIERADQLGIESLKLDATEQGQPLYESLGFRAEQPVERWWRPQQPPCGAAIQPASNLVDHDSQAYGADRTELLRALTKRSKVQAQPPMDSASPGPAGTPTTSVRASHKAWSLPAVPSKRSQARNLTGISFRKTN